MVGGNGRGGEERKNITHPLRLFSTLFFLVMLGFSSSSLLSVLFFRHSLP